MLGRASRCPAGCRCSSSLTTHMKHQWLVPPLVVMPLSLGIVLYLTDSSDRPSALSETCSKNPIAPPSAVDQ